jgi:hypothetical protein
MVLFVAYAFYYRNVFSIIIIIITRTARQGVSNTLEHGTEFSSARSRKSRKELAGTAMYVYDLCGVGGVRPRVRGEQKVGSCFSFSAGSREST